MGEIERKELARILWKIADELRGSMDAGDFKNYMLGFLFLKYLSYNYLKIIKAKLKKDDNFSLKKYYEDNKETIEAFEENIKPYTNFILNPDLLWEELVSIAKNEEGNIILKLEEMIKEIETTSLGGDFTGLFSDINLHSEKLGRTTNEKNQILRKIISEIEKGISPFRSEMDRLGDAYEYLIGQFAGNSGKKAGEFYTPQEVSSILSKIVVLDAQNPEKDKPKELKNILDFACGSGSLLLNVKKELEGKELDNKKIENKIGTIYGQEKNHTTYNLARMNMILHEVETSRFKIYQGDTLKNEWDIFAENNPANQMKFDAIVANPPFSLSWEPSDEMATDKRFANYGVSPRSAADFAFLLHGLHHLANDGVMAIILPHGVLFRSGIEGKIRKKLIDDNNIDTVIGLPANLFYSTGIPVCIIILKKCKKHKDILFINASKEFFKKKNQNILETKHIEKIVNAYKNREELEKYSKKVSLTEIIKNEYNLNISRYVDTSIEEENIDLLAVNKNLKELDEKIKTKTEEVNKLLKELGVGEV